MGLRTAGISCGHIVFICSMLWKCDCKPLGDIALAPKLAPDPAVQVDLTPTAQWFSILSVYQGMTCRECQCRLLDPRPRAPGSVGGAQAFAFLTSSKMMLMMLVWAPYLRTTVAEKEMTVQRWGTQRAESSVQGALCTPKLVHAHRHLTAYFYMPIYNTEVFSFSKSLKF